MNTLTTTVTISGMASFMIDQEDKASLKKFLSEEMAMPLRMHNAHRILWMSATNNVTTEVDLVTYLEIVKNTLQTDIIRPSWLTFAADSVEMFVQRGHFVEKSEDVSCLE